MNFSDKDIARAAVLEARRARLGEGHWQDVSMAVRLSNARSHLALAADYRRQAMA